MLRVEATVGTPGFVRGLAKKSKKFGDLGWDRLRAELLRLPVKLPELKTLALTSSRMPGLQHRGARVFPLEFGAPLRFQNPEALITFRATKKPSSSIVVELQSGEQHTLEVAGVQSSAILQRILEVGGMPAADVQTTMDIVVNELKVNAAPHGGNAHAAAPPRWPTRLLRAAPLGPREGPSPRGCQGEATAAR